MWQGARGGMRSDAQGVPWVPAPRLPQSRFPGAAEDPHCHLVPEEHQHSRQAPRACVPGASGRGSKSCAALLEPSDPRATLRSGLLCPTGAERLKNHAKKLCLSSKRHSS